MKAVNSVRVFLLVALAVVSMGLCGVRAEAQYSDTTGYVTWNIGPTVYDATANFQGNTLAWIFAMDVDYIQSFSVQITSVVVDYYDSGGNLVNPGGYVDLTVLTPDTFNGNPNSGSYSAAPYTYNQNMSCSIFAGVIPPGGETSWGNWVSGNAPTGWQYAHVYFTCVATCLVTCLYDNSTSNNINGTPYFATMFQVNKGR